MGTKMKDIANQLGISPSTVSRALKNDCRISTETRRKVFAIAQENQFNKKKCSSKKICYVIDKSYFLFTSNFYNPLIDVIEHAVQSKGYEFHFFSISGTEQLINSINLDEVAGILMTSSYIEGLIPMLNLYSIPVVLVDSYLPLEDTSAVITDNIAGLLKAVEFLTQRGHSRIGYLSGEMDDIDCVDRLSGFRKGIQLFQLETKQSDILSTKLSMSSSYQVMMKFLKETKDIPSAFIGANDIVTIGAMSACKDFGYRVPNDISFVGFDGIDLADEVVPSLCTVNVDRESMGSLAVDRLIELVEEKPVRFHKIMINPTMKKGDSVKDRSDARENPDEQNLNRKNEDKAAVSGLE